MNIQRIGKALHRAHIHQDRYITRHLGHLGLNPRILAYYMAISHAEGLSQKELTKHLATEKTQTAKAVKQLENLQYIVRQQDRIDHRINNLFLSAKGREIHPEVEKQIAIMDHLFSANYSESEIDLFINMLESFAQVIREDLESEQ